MALQMKKAPELTGTKWAKYDEETKILVAGIDNPEYQVALERMRRRIQRNDAQFAEGQVGVVSGEKTEHQNHCMLLANFIIKDWSGVQDEHGNPLKFSVSNVYDLLESNIDFFLFVLRQGSAAATESAQELAETVGKLSPASNGSESGRGKLKSDEPSTNA